MASQIQVLQMLRLQPFAGSETLGNLVSVGLKSSTVKWRYYFLSPNWIGLYMFILYTYKTYFVLVKYVFNIKVHIGLAKQSIYFFP